MEIESNPIQNSANQKKIYSAVWIRQLELVGKKRVYVKLQNSWSQNLAVSGLVAGFSFFIFSSPLSFNDTSYGFSSELITTIFGILLTTTFILAIGASIAALILLQWMEFVSDISLEPFIRNYYLFFDIPGLLLIISLICLAFSAIVSVMGLFDLVVVYVFAGTTCAMIIGLLCMEAMMITRFPAMIMTIKQPIPDDAIAEAS